MTQLEYKINNRYKNLRWGNWGNFVDNIKGSKRNKIAILSIHFNNFLNTEKLLEYIYQEDNKEIDIILIENSTNQEEKKKLEQFCKTEDRITYIQPISNLGSAGGYALGMEYILQQKYEYFFIVEDDVLFLDKSTFSTMIKCSNADTLTFINACKNTWSSGKAVEKGKSRRVQVAGYPTNFIEKMGIIDPRYFFRGEDLERGGRIEKGMHKYGYITKIIDHNYLHPYLKSVNGNYARFYFSIRNQLFSLEKHFTENISFFSTLFLYLRTAVSKLVVQKDSLIMKSYYDAISDFLLHKSSFENNKKKIGLFLKDNSKERHTKRVSNRKLGELGKKMYMNKKIICITGTDREKIHFSKKIGDIWKHGILISSSSTIFYPLTLLAPRVICINEFNLVDDTISIYQYENKHIFLKIFGILISFVVSLIVIIILGIIITAFVGFNRLYKSIC